jgi:NADH-quinone oxidoreductase subunit N
MDAKESLIWVFPEIILAVGALIVLCFALASDRAKKLGFGVAAIIPLAALLVLVARFTLEPVRDVFYGSLMLDPFSQVISGFFLVVGFVAVIASINDAGIQKVGGLEYAAFILCILCGMLLVSKASNLLMIYLALEMVSVPSYLAVAFFPASKESQEGGLKYVLFGALTSGILLYGLSLLYGFGGTLELYELPRALASREVPLVGFVAAMALVMVGFGFKITMFPFHAWAPDVYQGAPTAFTAFLSVGPKVAGFAVFTRVALSFFSTDAQPQFPCFNQGFYSLVALLSAATMTYGNFAALSQDNIKRMLAYSSIAHAGYALIGLAIPGGRGIGVLLYYLFVYAIMNMGAFLTVAFVSRTRKRETLSDYDGLGYDMPYVGMLLTLFLFSLTGIPPTVGFVGKFALFSRAIEGGLLWLVLIAALNTVVSLYYYVKVIKALYLGGSRALFPAESLPIVQSCTLGALGALTLFFGLFWDPMLRLGDLGAKIVLGV